MGGQSDASPALVFNTPLLSDIPAPVAHGCISGTAAELRWASVGLRPDRTFTGSQLTLSSVQGTAQITVAWGTFRTVALGLTPGTTYTVTVRLNSNLGLGPASNSSVFLTGSGELSRSHKEWHSYHDRTKSGTAITIAQRVAQLSRSHARCSVRRPHRPPSVAARC